MGSVKIVGRNDGWLHKPTTFEILVTGQGTEFAVQRRYKEFLELEGALRPQFPDLPVMPPRSYVVRRINPNFLDARQKHLAELLDAALAADPTISVPALRAFLGLDKDSSDTWSDCSLDLEQSQEEHRLWEGTSVTLCELASILYFFGQEQLQAKWDSLEKVNNNESVESSPSVCLECPLCLQCFEQQHALNCHMKFAHDWEPL